MENGWLSFCRVPPSKTLEEKGPYYFRAGCYGDELEEMWNNHQSGLGDPKYYPHFRDVELYRSSSLDGERLWCDITLLAKPEYDANRLYMEAVVHISAGAEEWTTKVIFRPNGTAGVVVAN